MSETVKPCPFCGGEGYPDSVLRSGYEGDPDDRDAHAYFVRCRSCACEGPWAKSSSGALTAWNRRAAPPGAEQEPEGERIEPKDGAARTWIERMYNGWLNVAYLPSIGPALSLGHFREIYEIEWEANRCAERATALRAALATLPPLEPRTKEDGLQSLPASPERTEAP